MHPHISPLNPGLKEGIEWETVLRFAVLHENQISKKTTNLLGEKSEHEAVGKIPQNNEVSLQNRQLLLSVAEVASSRPQHHKDGHLEACLHFLKQA